MTSSRSGSRSGPKRCRCGSRVRCRNCANVWRARVCTMADGRPDDEDDQAWLLARERGEPRPAISEVRARHYAQLSKLIAELPALPAGTVRREGWDQAVLSTIDAEIGRPADQNGASPAAVTDEARG